jgi:hypothetical protein
VQIWDVATGRKRLIRTGQTEKMSAVAIVPGRRGAPLAATTGRDCTWSPSGDSLAAAGYAGLYLFTFKP